MAFRATRRTSRNASGWRVPRCSNTWSATNRSYALSGDGPGRLRRIVDDLAALGPQPLVPDNVHHVGADDQRPEVGPELQRGPELLALDEVRGDDPGGVHVAAARPVVRLGNAEIDELVVPERPDRRLRDVAQPAQGIRRRARQRSIITGSDRGVSPARIGWTLCQIGRRTG